ncbi:MAG: class I SAM-dependent RNA methyltransferase [Acidobacteria bacterium]|nr:class I SAM-dependent RNA methyltransferase [Acidobacteriota bacterium]
MLVEIGSDITLDIEKPVAGGRMLARHEGHVVLVWGAIPGERIRARIERVGRGVLYAETAEVRVPSADRRDAGPDWRCGGNVFAHIAYERQLQLKAEIIRETLGRIGHLLLPAPPDVIGSPERGYRMRARLHARGGRLGFFREGSRHLCDAASTGQLLPETVEWIAAAERLVLQARLAGLVGVEIAENVRADERACHLELQSGIDAAPFVRLADAGHLTGLSAGRADRPGAARLMGVPSVSDLLRVREGDASSALRLRRDARAFFQGNRYLLEPLVRHVVGLVPPGPVVDLYAGVGLFGLSLAAAGREDITLVEGDPISGADLKANAEPFELRVTVDRRSVEAFLRMAGPAKEGTFIVDPPRTGLSKEALGGIVERQPTRIIYVSCDVATFARDTRMLLDAGYELGGVTGIDLFPNTAQVETIAIFSRYVGRVPRSGPADHEKSRL